MTVWAAADLPPVIERRKAVGLPERLDIGELRPGAQAATPQVPKASKPRAQTHAAKQLAVAAIR
jgi:hypothetical protein